MAGWFGPSAQRGARRKLRQERRAGHFRADRGWVHTGVPVAHVRGRRRLLDHELGRGVRRAAVDRSALGQEGAREPIEERRPTAAVYSPRCTTES